MREQQITREKIRIASGVQAQSPLLLSELPNTSCNMDHVSSRWLSNSVVEILTVFHHCNLQEVLSARQVSAHKATNHPSLNALIMSLIDLSEEIMALR